MIKAASVCTREIDDIEGACRQLKNQLDEKLPLMNNTVGIVHCNPEFIEAGIMGPLYRALNIPLVGGTTIGSATNDAVGSLMLSILVLTSNDVEFVVSRTEGFKNGCFDVVRQSLADALKKPRVLSQAPLRLVLAFPRITETVAGDKYINSIEDVCGKTPVFGTFSVDNTLAGFEDSKSICNDSAFGDEMTYVLLFGDVTPRFSFTTVPKKSDMADSEAVITKAKDNTVYQINNMRAIDYFESVGFAASGKFKNGSNLIPLIMTLPDTPVGAPFIRTAQFINPDGSVIFLGLMYEGATLSIGSYFNADVMSSTSETVTRIAHEENINTVLIYSCIVRQFVTGVDPMRELTVVRDLMGADIPFAASYAGGEISPVSVDSENNAVNRYHIFSFITCIL